MAEQEFDALVLKDTEGNYYVFDRDAFERARVTDESLLAEIDDQVDDSQGFAFTPFFQGPISAKPLPGIINGFRGPISHLPGQIELGGQSRL